MDNIKFKIGDKVKIIDCSSGVASCELNKIGTIMSMTTSRTGCNTYVVDMGRPRRLNELDKTCWWVREDRIELSIKPNEQLSFSFMRN